LPDNHQTGAARLLTLLNKEAHRMQGGCCLQQPMARTAWLGYCRIDRKETG
jgi:hypothetical protein